MARGQRDLMSRLTDVGEQAIQKLGESPSTKQFVTVASSLRDRVDELQRKVRGIDALEKRLGDLVKKVERLSKSSSSRSSSSSSSRSSSGAAKRPSGTTSRRKTSS